MTRCTYFLAFLFLTACASPASPPEPAEPPARSNRGSSAVQGTTPPAVVAPTLPVLRVNPERALGSPTAKLAIVEFADYQCPYCRTFHLATLPQLRAAYVDTGKVRYFYKDFPLANHQHAFSASVAAFCAGAQGKYWEMQDLLYTHQARLGAELYSKLVQELKLDDFRFEACQTSRVPRRAVSRDHQDGREVGITGTPSFVLGRIEGDRVIVERVATGAPAFDVFVREIEALLPE